ncbi:hypothetical protein PGTUg99_033419 [Puccinia graminis f. sp. tritici]|uniref:Uncharacterized protein n=1 Tax=Puccinia graminis f. sp. tritici TaxID=56615 RepID=A0A5B0RPY6_PUCGR|nr:hypothetical protein PGTUg99_033419 [Puccinia graminis f. sp. tritici]
MKIGDEVILTTFEIPFPSLVVLSRLEAAVLNAGRNLVIEYEWSQSIKAGVSVSSHDLPVVARERSKLKPTSHSAHWTSPAFINTASHPPLNLSLPHPQFNRRLFPGETS